MTDQKLSENPESESTEVTEKPRKIVLGKRVLRHFTVKSGVQTGEGGVTDLTSHRCCQAVA